MAISHGCRGVAARACGLVNLEPTKVSLSVVWYFIHATFMDIPHYFLFSSVFIYSRVLQVIEILKDRPSWFRDCRSLEVFTMFPAGNGGTIELVYMQVGDSVLLHS